MASTNQLTTLSQLSRIVADTGDFSAIRQYQPKDATTNPSLLLKTAKNPEFEPILDKIIRDCPDCFQNETQKIEYLCDQFAIQVGLEILSVVEGRVSTEVDACLSYDTESMIQKARQIIAAYQAHNIDKDRILIKIAATWEGLEAARVLTSEGIHCNLTLVFNLLQAAKAAEDGVYLISPFVGRILDWYKKFRDFSSQDPMLDPGVQSVHRIYHYYKEFNKKTVVMGASFRHIGQLQALAGCDALTIAPALLEGLSQESAPLTQALPSPAYESFGTEETVLSDALVEKNFRWQLNQDEMADSLLSEGIRKFHLDYIALQLLIKQRITG